MDNPLQYIERQLLSKLAISSYAVLPTSLANRLRDLGYLTKILADLPLTVALYAITAAGREALGHPQNWFVSDGDHDSNNFQIERRAKTLHVTLSHPLNDDNRVHYVEFNQDSVRASDGIRISYDYHRDGYVIEQPNEVLTGTATPNVYGSRTDWTETAFLEAWACNTRDAVGVPTQEEYDRADGEHRELATDK